MTLNPTWFAEDPVDLEHKQYKLLAYLLEVRKDFQAGRLDRYFLDIRYHVKNIECYSATRYYLENKDRPVTEEQVEHFKKVNSYPDNDPRTTELMKITKWAAKKLLKVLNEGLALWRLIEGDLNVFYVGEHRDNSGMVIIQYAGSPVVELYKFDYKPKLKEVTVKSNGYMESSMRNYADVVDKLTKDNGDKELMIIGVTSAKAYSTKEAVLPVLKQLMVSKIFTKNIIGLD